MVLRALVLGLALSCYQLDVEIALFAIRSSYTESYINYCWTTDLSIISKLLLDSYTVDRSH